MNGSGAGAESLAAKLRAGDGLEGYLGRWLVLQVAGGDVEAEDNPHRREREAEHGGHRHELVSHGERGGEQSALGGGPRGGRQYISPRSSPRRGGVEIDGA